MQMPKRPCGFTLVELVMVIVLLGIISAVLAPVITSNVTAFSDTRSRNDLIARGRIALERLSREIRQAVPNSLRLVAGTSTIEFVTASAGGRYVDFNDTLITPASCASANRFRTGVSRNSLCLIQPDNPAPFAANDILVIGNTSPASLQAGTTWVTLNGVGGAAPLWTVTFNPTTFVSASPGLHYSIADFTHEVGLVVAERALHWRRNAGIPAGEYNNSVEVNAADPLLVDGVTATVFRYNAAADGMLNIELTLADSNETVQLYEEIYVRNTP